MWTVKSEAGRLRTVLVHDAGFTQYELNDGLITLASQVVYDRAVKQIHVLYDLLKEAGVKVFELSEIIKKIVEDSTLQEKKDIIMKIWGDDSRKPKPEELIYEHVLNGYPPEPQFDEENDRVILPDSIGWGFRRISIYSRDPSFGTSLGHVLCKMGPFRVKESRVVRLALENEPKLKEKVEIIYDQNKDQEAVAINGVIEGGGHMQVDEETILCGAHERYYAGFIQYMKKMFEKDVDKKIKYMCAVRGLSHIDGAIGFVDKGKAIVDPYILSSDMVDFFPTKKLLIQLIETKRAMLEKQYLSEILAQVPTAEAYLKSGKTHVYGRGNNGKPVRLSVEKNLIDFLIKEEKLDKDGIILLGGKPKKKFDMWHLFHSRRESRALGANVIAIEPGLIIAYERNVRTFEELKEHNIKVKKLPDTYLDLFGGPHCMTCPLDRDPL